MIVFYGTAFHGTTSVYLKKIMREGLRPSSETGYRGGLLKIQAIQGGECEPIFLERICLTDDLGFARDIARYVAEMVGGEPVILKIKPPLLGYNPLPLDSSSIFELRVEGIIPPEALEVVKEKG